MYLFFCFKQKAAYEVRISDWSSDVCSSDLFTRHVLVCLHRGRTGRRGRTLARAVRSHGRRPRAGRLAFVPEARQSDALGNQIGRASCRERVGQYVYISVVAVSLKKISHISYSIKSAM